MINAGDLENLPRYLQASTTTDSITFAWELPVLQDAIAAPGKEGSSPQLLLNKCPTPLIFVMRSHMYYLFYFSLSIGRLDFSQMHQYLLSCILVS